MDNQCEGIDWDYLRPWWRIQDALWEEEEEAGNHPVWEQRRIGDRFTWTIEFSIRGITCKPKVPDFVLEHCHFRLSKKTDDGSGEGNTGLSWYDLRCAPLKAPVLKFQYTHGGPHYGSLVPIPSDRHEDFVGSWRTLVLQRTDRLTLLELQKMDPSDRPVNYNVIYGEYAALVKKPNRKLDFRVSKIKKPKGWRHVDEDIPRWYHAWEKKTDQSTQKSVTYLS